MSTLTTSYDCPTDAPAAGDCNLVFRWLSMGRTSWRVMAVASEGNGEWAAYVAGIGYWGATIGTPGDSRSNEEADTERIVDQTHRLGDKMDPTAAASLFPEIAARARWRS